MILRKRGCWLWLIAGLCAAGGATGAAQECVENFDAGRDYFPAKADIRAAERFHIEYHRSYKIVTVRFGEEDSPALKYLLVLCGTPAPQIPGVTASVSIPVRTVAALSNAYVPFLDIVGAVENIIAVNDYRHVSNPALRERIGANGLAAVGRESNLDRERLAALAPDMILSYGDARPPEALLPLVRAGLDVVVTAEYRELHPLAYAEWSKFFAAFFNAEARADQAYRDIAARYEKLRARTANVQRPSVMVGGGYRGVWYAPAPRSYTAQLIADAGGRYAFSGIADAGASGEAFTPIDLETALAHGRSADIWIDTPNWRSLTEALTEDDRYGLFEAFTAGRVFNNDLRRNDYGANEFWESALTRPDSVLADLIALFHPELVPGHILRWYRKLPAVTR